MDTSSNFKVYAYDLKDNDTTNESYNTKRKVDLKKIKKLLKDNPNAKIEYYNNWIRVCGTSFNGFSKEFLLKHLQTCK